MFNYDRLINQLEYTKKKKSIKNGIPHQLNRQDQISRSVIEKIKINTLLNELQNNEILTDYRTNNTHPSRAELESPNFSKLTNRIEIHTRKNKEKCEIPFNALSMIGEFLYELPEPKNAMEILLRPLQEKRTQ
ncbi:hypothetical protein BC833DRAFT_564801 [Globomyces pollinis-pini]|nr:hypothetical protein BC833DRAFT_564801 [Globomyces pollinis-pini]